MTLKRVAFVRTTDLQFDSRSIRSLDFFISRDYSGYILAWDRRGAGVKHFERFQDISFYKTAEVGAGWSNIFKLLKFGLYSFRKLLRLDIDLIYACDLDAAIPSILVSKIRGIPIVFDQYDSYTSRFKSKFSQLILSKVEEIFLKSSNLRIFASIERLNQSVLTDSFVIENCPDIEVEREFNLRNRLKVFFGGIYLENRFLRELLEIAETTNTFDLTFAGYGPLGNLIREYTKFPHIEDHGPMAPEDMLRLLAKQDLCLAVYNPIDPNNKVAAVSKVYESAIAGTPIVAARGTSTAKIVDDFNLGWCIETDKPLKFLDVLGERAAWTLEEYNNYLNRCDTFLQAVQVWRNNFRLVDELETFFSKNWETSS